MDIQEESEFNETMNLVKAVLERLEFHAFEDVLIWSNEHASKALLRCFKKTLSEFENGHLVLTSSYPKLKHFSVDSVVRGLMTALDQAQERQDNLNREINELEDQLAKAQAVPEWISTSERMPEEGEEVLVHSLGQVRQVTRDSKWAGGFKERNCYGWQAAYSQSHWMPKSIELPEQYHFYYENDAKQKAMIEAQEQKG